MKIYCDTHVHCYQFEKLDSLLSYSYENLASQARIQQSNTHQLVLFFTDGNGDKTWPKLNQALNDRQDIGSWQLHSIDQGKLIGAQNGEKSLILAPARQINSAERLEFLLLGCELNITDGETAEQIINNYGDQYPIISPWGVGKWLGQRGELLSQLIQQYGQKFQLGDNGGRPVFWRCVKHFSQTQQAVINGSDPLPLGHEIQRVGSFGVHFQIQQSEITLQTLLDAFNNTNIEKHNFGSLLPISQFFKGRIGLLKN